MWVLLLLLLPPGLWLWVPFWAVPALMCSPLGSSGTPYLSQIFKVSGGILCREGETHGGSSLLALCLETGADTRHTAGMYSHLIA